jgi:hypothetical protein
MNLLNFLFSLSFQDYSSQVSEDILSYIKAGDIREKLK